MSFPVSISDTIPVPPERRYPILIVGAGGIAKDAHLPAYRLVEFPVWGLCYHNREHAESLSLQFSVPHAFSDPHGQGSFPACQVFLSGRVETNPAPMLFARLCCSNAVHLSKSLP